MKKVLKIFGIIIAIAFAILGVVLNLLRILLKMVKYTEKWVLHF